MEKLHHYEHKTTLRDLLNNGDILGGEVKICRKISSSRAWNYSGIIEFEILKVMYKEEIIKIKYLTTLPEYYKKDDEVWLDFNRCDEFEVVNI